MSIDGFFQKNYIPSEAFSNIDESTFKKARIFFDKNKDIELLPIKILKNNLLLAAKKNESDFKYNIEVVNQYLDKYFDISDLIKNYCLEGYSCITFGNCNELYFRFFKLFSKYFYVKDFYRSLVLHPD